MDLAILVEKAIEEGDIGSLERVEREGDYLFSSLNTTLAAYCGELEVLQWLHRRGVVCDGEVIADAIRGERPLIILPWLKRIGAPLERDVFEETPQGEVKEWLEEHLFGGTSNSR